MQFSSIDTPSGHIVCGFLLILIGAGFYLAKIPKGEDILVAGATVVTVAMKGLGAKNGSSPPAP